MKRNETSRLKPITDYKQQQKQHLPLKISKVFPRNNRLILRCVIFHYNKMKTRKERNKNILMNLINESLRENLQYQRTKKNNTPFFLTQIV